MKTEIYNNPDEFMLALKGKPRKAAKDARPGLPRAQAGEGDRLAQVMRIAAYGYSPRWDAGVGFCFWQPTTGHRTQACAEYAQACIEAEKELKP